MALPNMVFRRMHVALAEVGLPEGAQWVEAPFGRDEADASALNDVLHRSVPENAVFRINHSG
jgi:glucose-6-phosphate 1-dehydrogenase